jgi:hypothetical protein
MKCRICGHRSNTIKAMGAHFRKKHPGAMKRSPNPDRYRPRRYRPGAAQGESIPVFENGTWHPAGCRCQGCK